MQSEGNLGNVSDFPLYSICDYVYRSALGSVCIKIVKTLYLFFDNIAIARSVICLSRRCFSIVSSVTSACFGLNGVTLTDFPGWSMAKYS